jgi:hypothetical protein
MALPSVTAQQRYDEPMDTQEVLKVVPPPTHSTWRDSRCILLGALIIYAIAATFFSVREADYINADFVAYATIAHRFLHHPAAALSGFWSPLFSWFMAPLIYFGASDLVAGRAILVLAGALYIVSIYWLIARIRTDKLPPNSCVLAGVIACAVLQATLWATYLLDPDLLAAAFLFCYFATVVNPSPSRNMRRPFFGGIAAGLAFLAKAYMLPFVLGHLLITLLLRRRVALRFVAPLVVGLTLIAAPWISILTTRFHRLTFSTAGSINHAKVSPADYGHNPVWNTGLIPNYVIDRPLAPDWSPLQDRQHLYHQLKLIAKNAGDCSTELISWLLFTLAAVACWRIRVKRKKETIDEPTRSTIVWCLITILIYVAGYMMIQVQSRYVVPIVAPLLCLIGFMLIIPFSPTQTHAPNPNRFALLSSIRIGLLLLLPFSVQDGFHLAHVAIVHPQSQRLSHSRAIASQLQQIGALNYPMACNHWHGGLFVAYASDHISTYLGAPVSGDPNLIEKQLQDVGVRCYLRWLNPNRDPASMTLVDRFVPPRPWKKILVVRDPALRVRQIEVYGISTDPPGSLE